MTGAAAHTQAVLTSCLLMCIFRLAFRLTGMRMQHTVTSQREQVRLL